MSEPMQALSPDELLTTTRAVRKRLDLTRPVSRELIVDCVRIALQAPSASNRWPLQFVVVDDPAIRRQLGIIYRSAYDVYRSLDGIYIATIDKGSPERNEQQLRTATSAEYLAEHIAEAPALVLGVVVGRRDDAGAVNSLMASAMPGMWSFMLAARARGVGTAWTSVHLIKEVEVNELLGFPDDVMSFCLTPVAYTKGTTFKPAMRPDPSEVMHWNGWSGGYEVSSPPSTGRRAPVM